MKILHVYRTFFPDTQGGLEEAIRQICMATQTLGADTRVLSCSPNPDIVPIVINGIEVYRAKQFAEIASCNLSIRAFAMYRKLSEWADVIHFHFPWPMADLLDFFSRTNKPTVLTYHSDIVRQKFWMTLYRPLMISFLRNVNAIIPTSQRYADSSPVLSAFKDKLAVIPLGLDEKSYPHPDQRIVENISRDRNITYFLFVGVLRYYKGLDFLVEAVRNAPFDVIIAGTGPEEGHIRNKVNKDGISNVQLVGQISDAEKVALMQHARGVVLPSHLRSEAFGVTLVEGAMFAKPLITTEIGTGTSFVCNHSENGLIVPPANSHALRDALFELWRNNSLAERMGEASRTRYESLFTAQRMASSYMQLYRDLIQSP